MGELDDKKTERWRMDCFAALRKIFESFNVNCATLCILSQYLVIDKTFMLIGVW